MKLDNILLINTFGIGDVLFSTPLLKEIKRNLPHSNIHFICNRRNFDLLKNDPYIKSVLVYEKDEFREIFSKSKIKFFKKLINFINDVKRIKADVAIDLTLNYQMSLIMILAGVRTRIGFDYKNRGRLLTHKIPLSGFDNMPIVLHYLGLLKFLNLPLSGDYRLTSYTSEENKRIVDNFLKEKGLIGKTLVGLAAGGGKSWGRYALYRRWDSKNFAYVGLKLSEFPHVGILIFGTHEDKVLCDEIYRIIGQNAISLCGNTTLDLLIEFISRCKLLICNEGGPLHIAVSQKVKTVSIFGPVDDKVYGPYPPSEEHKVIKAENVECRPCYKNFKHRKCKMLRCLKEINRDRVLNAAKESLGL